MLVEECKCFYYNYANICMIFTFWKGRQTHGSERHGLNQSYVEIYMYCSQTIPCPELQTILSHGNFPEKPRAKA